MARRQPSFEQPTDASISLWVQIGKFEPCHGISCLWGFLHKSDTNQAVQPHTSGLKFRK